MPGACNPMVIHMAMQEPQQIETIQLCCAISFDKVQKCFVAALQQNHEFWGDSSPTDTERL